jgi:hypothetical protein
MTKAEEQLMMFPISKVGYVQNFTYVNQGKTRNGLSKRTYIFLHDGYFLHNVKSRLIQLAHEL